MHRLRRGLFNDRCNVDGLWGGDRCLFFLVK